MEKQNKWRDAATPFRRRSQPRLCGQTCRNTAGRIFRPCVSWTKLSRY